MAVHVPAEEASTIGARVRDEDARWSGSDALVHPHFIGSQMYQLLLHSHDQYPSMQYHSRIQQLASVRAGQTLSLIGRFVDASERNAGRFLTIAGAILGEDGRELVRVRYKHRVPHRGALARLCTNPPCPCIAARNLQLSLTVVSRRRKLHCTRHLPLGSERAAHSSHPGVVTWRGAREEALSAGWRVALINDAIDHQLRQLLVVEPHLLAVNRLVVLAEEWRTTNR